MSDELEWVKDVALVLVGLLAGWGTTWWERRRRVKTHRAALAAEMRMCVKRATTFRTDNIASPAYRSPMQAHAAAFPSLLTDASLSADDVDAIEEFYAEVGDFNRCLDYVHDARDKTDDWIMQEHSRARIKAQNVLDRSRAALGAVAQ